MKVKIASEKDKKESLVTYGRVYSKGGEYAEYIGTAFLSFYLIPILPSHGVQIIREYHGNDMEEESIGEIRPLNFRSVFAGYCRFYSFLISLFLLVLLFDALFTGMVTFGENYVLRYYYILVFFISSSVWFFSMFFLWTRKNQNMLRQVFTFASITLSAILPLFVSGILLLFASCSSKPESLNSIAEDNSLSDEEVILKMAKLSFGENSSFKVQKADRGLSLEISYTPDKDRIYRLKKGIEGENETDSILCSIALKLSLLTRKASSKGLSHVKISVKGYMLDENQKKQLCEIYSASIPEKKFLALQEMDLSIGGVLAFKKRLEEIEVVETDKLKDLTY